MQRAAQRKDADATFLREILTGLVALTFACGMVVLALI
jgi:hypothetical protein